jgi:hypothetical protein
MTIDDLSSTAGASWDANQMNSVSGASGYVPASSSGASSTESVVAQMRSNLQQNSQDFASLKSALISNNLTGATQAFTTLQQDLQSASSSAGGKSPFSPNSAIRKDYQAISKALQSGDLPGAKQAFAAFKADIKRAGRAARAQNVQAASSTNDGDADEGAQGSVGPTTAATTGLSTSSSILNTTA